MDFEVDEKFKILAAKYPIGSKIIANLVDYDVFFTNRVLKIYGYGYHLGELFLLVYNPEIKGHDGLNRAHDVDGITLDREILSAKYGKHFWFVAEKDISEE